MPDDYLDKLSPVRLHTVYDYIVVILIGVACIPYVFGIFVIVYNKDYRPIKVRSMTLTVMSALGGLVWVLATIVVNNHFGRRKNTFWTICSLWTFWLQFCYGFGLWLNCMTIHLMQLYCLLILKKDVKKQHTFMWIIALLLALLSPVIITCILASIYHASREIRNGGVMSLFVFLLSLVTLQTRTYIQIVGRCFLSLSVALVVFYYFWVRNGEIIYNVLFHRKAYEIRFHEDINRSLLESRDNPREGKMALQNVLHKMREDAVMYLQEVKELEGTRDRLKQACEELEKQLNLSKSLSFEISPQPE